jgi:hemolysin D
VAPVGGILSSLKVANEGEVLQPGDTLAEIAPASAPLVLSAMLPSQEAGLVETGMPVNIKFDAFPYQDYGIVEGTVLSISPDAEVSEATGAIYHVEVALSETAMEHEGKAVPLRAGQTATAEIIVSKRRIISLVLDPIRKLQNSNISL